MSRRASKSASQSAALRAEIVTRDTFLERVSQGLDQRVAALSAALEGAAIGAPAREALAALTGFSRELGLIARLDTQVGEAREVIDLGEVLRAMMEAHQDLIAKGGRPIELTVRGPAPIACARADVELIVAELMSNAMKHGNGPIHVLVDTARARARLTVRDGGPGVAPEDRRRVTARFVRGAGARPRTGYGVGLWLVRKVARGYGGDLRLSDGSIGVEWPLAPAG